MKKKSIIMIFSIIIVVLITYLIATPIGALRFAILREGYPIKSITMKLSDTPYEIGVKDNENCLLYTSNRN